MEHLAPRQRVQRYLAVADPSRLPLLESILSAYGVGDAAAATEAAGRLRTTRMMYDLVRHCGVAEPSGAGGGSAFADATPRAATHADGLVNSAVLAPPHAVGDAPRRRSDGAEVNGVVPPFFVQHRLPTAALVYGSPPAAAPPRYRPAFEECDRPAPPPASPPPPPVPRGTDHVGYFASSVAPDGFSRAEVRCDRCGAEALNPAAHRRHLVRCREAPPPAWVPKRPFVSAESMPSFGGGRPC
jgi:hypothetical protein